MNEFDASPDFQHWMASVQDRVEKALAHHLPSSQTIPAQLHQAMRYACLNGGKRVRPLLVMAAGLSVIFFAGLPWRLVLPPVLVGAVGLVLMYLISNINYRSLRHMNWYLYILTLLLLVWALFSEPYNGCYRWVYMFGTTLQPSELAKFSAILGLACFADRYYEKRGTLLYGIVLPVLPLLPVGSKRLGWACTGAAAAG